ncbi:unnamed protein product [Ciceribacter sp. T2.26MG-112.2]|nr:unnamed protein product [Ciceribacter naphthalenivorans]
MEVLTDPFNPVSGSAATKTPSNRQATSSNYNIALIGTNSAFRVGLHPRGQSQPVHATRTGIAQGRTHAAGAPSSS